MEQKRIGKYVLLDKVGEGAMGEVYKAHDPVLNRFVAIKTIAESRDADPEIRQRFLREAQSSAQLNHPNIITVFDMGEERGKVFMCMELLEGVDLKDLIRSRTPISLRQKLNLMEQICSGLAFAHSKGIVHRDLKPGNIHILPGNQVKVMDFGLARLASSDMTQTGLVMGTPDYMSPEQVQARHVDARSDVFSLGAVFYELLTHRKPFHAESIHAILFKVVQGDREPLTPGPELPASLIELVDRALSKEPTKRFQNADEMREALRTVTKELESAEGEDEDAPDLWETVVTVKPQDAPPTTEKPLLTPPAPPFVESRSSRRTVRSTKISAPRRSPRILAVAAAVCLVVGGGLALLLFTSDSSSEKVVSSEAEEVDASQPEPRGRELEAARRSLEEKDYRAAFQQAEVILAQDPENAVALDIRNEAQSTLEELDVAVREARALLASGNSERAAHKLALALSIDASHPVATELSAQLKGHFRDQAEGARAEMSRARGTARSAGASSLAGFGQAERVAEEAEAELSRQEFALAYQKFTSARDRFARAQRAAEQEAERQVQADAARTELQRVSSRWGELQSQAQSQAEDIRGEGSYQTALSLEGEAQRLTDAGDYPAAARAYREAIDNLRAAAEQAASKRREREVAAAARTTPPRPETPPPPPTSSSISVQELDEQGIRKVIADWERAIETQDIELYRSVKPNLSGEDESRLAASFQAVRSHQVEIAVLSIDILGDRATARLAREDTIEANGRRHSNAIQQTLALSKQSGKWVLVEIGQ